jgi:hypothetical protein
MEVKEQYQVQISKDFKAVENLDDDDDDDDDDVNISGASKRIRENMKDPATGSLGYYKMRQLKTVVRGGGFKINKSMKTG